jgi:signal peptidase II
MVWIIIIVLLSAADQLLKALIRTQIAVSERVTVIEGFFYIINRKNPGAAWSFLAGQSWGIYVLAGVSLVVTSLLLVLLFRVKLVRLKVCLSVICAGSIGNLIDRMLAGGVTDYLDFHFGRYIFPTFNLADTLLVCGSILLGLLIVFDPDLLPALLLEKADGKKKKSQGGQPGADNHPR